MSNVESVEGGMPSNTGRTAPPPPKVWRGTTLAERRVERRNAILDAAIDIVGSEGAAALTTRAVSTRSGFRESYIYEGFGSRDDLLLAVFDSVLARQFTAIRSAFSGDAPVLDQVATMCRSVLAVAELNPGHIRILFVEPTSDPVLRQRTGVIADSLKTAATELVLARSLGGRLSPAQIDAVATMIVGGAITLFTAWSEGRLDVSADQLVELQVHEIQRWIEPATPSLGIPSGK